MKIKIFWNNDEANTLLEKVNFAVDELGLNDFIESEITNDKALMEELKISKEPALIIEEESIWFKDMIFEWMIPEIEELKSMFVSIVWGGEAGEGWCSSWGCWGCGTPCG